MLQAIMHPVVLSRRIREHPESVYRWRLFLLALINFGLGSRYFPRERAPEKLPEGLQLLTGYLSIHWLGAFWMLSAIGLLVGMIGVKWERRALRVSTYLWLYWGLGYFTAYAFFEDRTSWYAATLYLVFGLMQRTLVPKLDQFGRRRPR